MAICSGEGFRFGGRLGNEVHASHSRRSPGAQMQFANKASSSVASSVSRRPWPPCLLTAGARSASRRVPSSTGSPVHANVAPIYILKREARGRVVSVSSFVTSSP